MKYIKIIAGFAVVLSILSACLFLALVVWNYTDFNNKMFFTSMISIIVTSVIYTLVVIDHD